MNDTRRHRIAQWFADHEDGEFGICERMVPYTVIGPPLRIGRIVIVTKPRSVLALNRDSRDFDSLGVIGRYGLPAEADVNWIRNLAGEHELLFLGDMDPVDLLVFAWLRASLHPKPITLLGVNDQYLAALKVTLPESFVMKCSNEEREALPLVKEVFPDMEATIGTRCAGLLDDGRKIEIEAVVSTLHALPSETTILTPALPI